MLVVRGSALLEIQESAPNISLSGGDLFIFILSDEPFTLMDHARSAVVDSSEVLKLQVDGVIHTEEAARSQLGEWVVWHEYIRSPLISTILPRFCTCSLNKSKSHAFNPYSIFWRQKPLSAV